MNAGTDLLKATEEVLILLEKSKQRVDQAIDSLPGIYLVIDEEGTVFRHNLKMKSYMTQLKKTDESLWKYMDSENRDILQNKMKLAELNFEKSFSCEITLKDKEERTTDYSLTLFAWSLGRTSIGPKVLYTIHGKDVSELNRVSREKEALMQEIIGAEQVQKVMVPETQLKNRNFELSCYYRAASNCGGDFLHYSFNDECLRIWAGDVTGHGVGSAMVSGAIRAAVSLIEQDAQVSLSEAMLRLNKCLLDITCGSYWMTFQIFEADFKSKKIKLCQAGHEDVFALEKPKTQGVSSRNFYPLILRPSTHLGRDANATYAEQEIPLQKDCLYFCSSDGIVEATNPDGRMFNHRRMLKCISENFQKTNDLEQSKETLLKTVDAYREYRPMDDDISLWMVYTS